MQLQTAKLRLQSTLSGDAIAKKPMKALMATMFMRARMALVIKKLFVVVNTLLIYHIKKDFCYFFTLLDHQKSF